MQSLVAGLHEFFERANQLAMSSCGSCYGPGRDRQPVDSSLLSLFDVSPLGDVDPEAVRGTQNGARSLHEGRVDEAIREFHGVCNRLLRSAVARTNLGSAYFERGDEDAALHWFKEAHRLDPRSCRILRAVAVLEQRSGNHQEAVWLLRNYLNEVDEFNMQVLHQLAMLYRDRQQWTQAGTCFRRLLKADPTNREIAKELQVCLDRSSAYGDGLELRCDERSAEVLLGPGPCEDRFSSHGRPTSQEVRPWEMRGRQADRRSGSVDRRAGSAERRLSMGDRRAGSAERRLGSADRRAGNAEGGALWQADEQRANGNLQQAYTMYRKILDGDSGNTEALRGVVLCLLETGHGSTAIEAAKRLQALKSSDAEANLLLAEAMLAAGRVPESLNAVPSQPHLRSRLMMAQAKVALIEEDFKKALSLASEAVRMETGEGGDVKALLLLAEVRIQFADYEAALRALSSAEQALRKEQRAVARPLLAQAHSLAAKAQERLRRLPEALEEARRALELDPGQSIARLARAMAMQQSGRAKDAEVELRDLLRRNPQDSEVCVLLGYLQLCSGNSSAASTLQEAVSQTTAQATRKSLAGTAKIYLALALDSQGQDLADGQVRAEQLVREGLKQHRNLQHVWRAQEKLLHQQQPPYTAAVQQLRGICDLDLTTLQARRLLALLARSGGRHDLVRPLASTGACGASSRAGSMPPPNRQWVPSRAGSQAPTPSDRRSLSPMGYASQGHQAHQGQPQRMEWVNGTGLGATYGYGGAGAGAGGFGAFGQPPMSQPLRLG